MLKEGVGQDAGGSYQEALNCLKGQNYLPKPAISPFSSRTLATGQLCPQSPHEHNAFNFGMTRHRPMWPQA